MIPEFVRVFVTTFKIDPKRAARIVVECIGWLTVVLGALDLVIPQAIAILRQVLVGLGS